MSNPHAPFLMAEQQIQEIAEELNRLRDVTRLLSGAQTGIDQVLQSFQQLNERVADLTRHLQSAMMTDEAVRITKLNDTLQQVKQGLESIQVSQHESMPHLETLLKTPEYLRLAIDQQAKHHREQQVQLKHTEKSLHTQIEQAFQHTARDVHALVDRLEAIETRQKTIEEGRLPELNDTLQQVKQGLESIQVSQRESMLHLDTLLKTLDFFRLAIDQQAKHLREQQVQLKHTEKSLHTQIEQAFQHTARDVHALVDRLEAIETRQKWSIWLLAFIATLVLVGLAISI